MKWSFGVVGEMSDGNRSHTARSAFDSQQRCGRSIQTFLVALASAVILSSVNPAAAATLSFTADATLSVGVTYPWYPAEIQGVIEFATTPSSSVASGDGVAHYGAGTMTLSYVGGGPNGLSDVVPINLFAQQDYSASGEVHDFISIGTAAPPSNAVYGATTFTLNLFGGTDLLGGEGFADVLSVLSSPSALASLVPSGTFASTGYLNTVFGTYVVYGQTMLETSAVPVPAAAWLLSSGLFGLVTVARRRHG